MTVDRLALAVREQIAFGRVLPLGEAGDGAWITESAAADALRGAAAGLTGVRLGALRIGPEAGREADEDSSVFAPPSAVPYGPLCVAATFEAAIDRPLPESAERLRAALWSAAHDLLGLAVTSVDLDVTGLMDPDEAPGPDRAPDAPQEAGPVPAGDAIAAAALQVPGVARLTSRLGGFLPGISTAGIRTADGGDPPGRRVRVQIAVAPGHRALDVARAVGEAVTKAAGPGTAVTAAVVVTAIG